jgi:hypothetical protein
LLDPDRRRQLKTRPRSMPSSRPLGPYARHYFCSDFALARKANLGFHCRLTAVGARTLPAVLAAALCYRALRYVQRLTSLRKVRWKIGVPFAQRRIRLRSNGYNDPPAVFRTCLPRHKASTGLAARVAGLPLCKQHVCSWRRDGHCQTQTRAGRDQGCAPRLVVAEGEPAWPCAKDIRT